MSVQAMCCQSLRGINVASEFPNTCAPTKPTPNPAISLGLEPTVHEVPFRMSDPYSPIARSIAGMPGREVFNDDNGEAAGFVGFGDSGFRLGPDIDIGGSDGVGGMDRGVSGIDWGSILPTIIKSTPAIVQAARGQGTPTGFYGQSYQLPQLVPTGYQRDPTTGQLIPLGSAAQAAGGLGLGIAQIGNSLTGFIVQNPLLILGGVVALALLFKQPPRRR